MCVFQKETSAYGKHTDGELPVVAFCRIAEHLNRLNWIMIVNILHRMTHICPWVLSPYPPPEQLSSLAILWPDRPKSVRINSTSSHTSSSPECLWHHCLQKRGVRGVLSCDYCVICSGTAFWSWFGTVHRQSERAKALQTHISTIPCFRYSLFLTEHIDKNALKAQCIVQLNRIADQTDSLGVI